MNGIRQTPHAQPPLISPKWFFTLKPGGKFTGYLQKKEGKYRVTITNVDFNFNGDLVENIDDAALKKGEMKDNTRAKKVIQLFDRYFNEKFNFSNIEEQSW